MPQGRGIFPYLTVRENLLMGFETQRLWRSDALEEIDALFPVLKSMAQRTAGVLSGGQQQQLAIARALVAEPKVLLLDEPTEGIQPNVIQQIGDALRRLADERGMAIAMVEQYVGFVREIGDRFFLMDRRRVVASGLTSDLTVDLVHRHLAV